MRSKDILAICGVAAITATFVIVTASPRWGEAEGENPLGIPQVFPPKLTVDGCEFAATAQLDADNPEKAPKVTVTVTNTTDKQVSTKITLSMTSQSAASMFSRRLVIPTPVWTQECAVNLSPGETTSFTYEPENKIEKGSMVSISLMNADQAKAAANTIVIPGGAVPLQIDLETIENAASKE